MPSGCMLAAKGLCAGWPSCCTAQCCTARTCSLVSLGLNNRPPAAAVQGSQGHALRAGASAALTATVTVHAGRCKALIRNRICCPAKRPDWQAVVSLASHRAARAGAAGHCSRKRCMPWLEMLLSAAPSAAAPQHILKRSQTRAFPWRAPVSQASCKAACASCCRVPKRKCLSVTHELHLAGELQCRKLLVVQPAPAAAGCPGAAQVLDALFS